MYNNNYFQSKNTGFFFQNSSTVHFFMSHRSKRIGYITHRGWWVSQGSSQKSVLSPLLVWIFLPFKYTHLIWRKSFHIGESSILPLTVDTKSLERYFFWIICCQSPSSFLSFHHHLHSKLMFIFWISLMPSPLLFLLLQIVVHLARWYFLLRLPPCQKKDLLCPSNFLVIVLGSK